MKKITPLVRYKWCISFVGIRILVKYTVCYSCRCSPNNLIPPVTHCINAYPYPTKATIMVCKFGLREILLWKVVSRHTEYVNSETMWLPANLNCTDSVTSSKLVFSLLQSVIASRGGWLKPSSCGAVLFLWILFMIIPHCKEPIPKIRNKYFQRQLAPFFITILKLHIF